MSHLIMKWGIGIFSVFVVIAGSLHWLAYDDAYLDALEAIIIESDCDAPCFLDIQPGITHSRDVEAILKADTRIGALERVMVQNDFTGVRWAWRDEYRDWSDGQGLVNIWYGSVDWIAWQPDATYGEVLLALGIPDSHSMQFRETFTTYDAYDMTLRVIPDCERWWAGQVQIVYGIDISGFRAPSWGDMMRAMC